MKEIKQKIGKGSVIILLLLIICSGIVIPLLLDSGDEEKVHAARGGFTANVMAPLHVQDVSMSQFEADLVLARDMGVDGVSVDVWWGDVEKEDNAFDWSYYDDIFSKITETGLEIVPIMSFHQCGGNVGDNYTSYLPSWVWTKYHGRDYEGMALDWNDLKYVSSRGNASAEYLALWVDELVEEEYLDFMNAFEDHFSDYASRFMEINISCGPAGELRYPSYNAHDAGEAYSGFPHAGYLQCYSDLAIADFQKKMLEKYGNIEEINKAWGTNLQDQSQILPPQDGRDFFYGAGRAYLDMTYGRDFIAWYNGSLVDHGRRMLDYGEEAFDKSMKGVQLGIKVPGIHWQINNESYPRTAEICAGIIDTDFSQENGNGYNPILDMLQPFEERALLHFTCLEMNNKSGDSTSAAKTLVGWVGDAAYVKQVEVKGENALSGGNDQRYFWTNIDEAMRDHHYNGVTILRMRDVVVGKSSEYFREVIERYGE